MMFCRKSFKRGVREIMELRALRWMAFKALSRVGWWICPEPHRTRLHQGMRFDPNWKSCLPTRGSAHAP